MLENKEKVQSTETSFSACFGAMHLLLIVYTFLQIFHNFVALGKSFIDANLKNKAINTLGIYRFIFQKIAFKNGLEAG